MNTQYIVGSPKGKQCFEFIITARQKGRKSAQYKVKSRHYKLLLLKTENL